MTTQTNQLTCSEQIEQIRDIEPFASVGQFNEQKVARGWNLVLSPLVKLIRAYVKENDADKAALEARVASLESQLAKALEAVESAKAQPKKQPKAE